MGAKAKKPAPAPTSGRRTNPSQPQLLVLGLLAGVCVWLLYFALKQIVPNGAPWSLSELSIAVLVLVWFVFGAEPAESAHASLKKWLNSKRRIQATVACAGFCCAASAVLVWYVAPGNALSRAQMAGAIAAAPNPFFEPCVQEIKPPGKDFSASNLVGLHLSTTCIPSPMPKLVEAARTQPVLLVGEPSSGKRIVLKQLRAELAKAETTSVFLTVRDCAKAEQPSDFVSACERYSLLREALESFAPDRAAAATESYLAGDDWWLFIDGLDDPGDENLVVPMLRSLRSRTKKASPQIVANARTQNLANILFHTRIDDDVRDTMRAFAVYSVSGLSMDGAREMLTHELKVHEDVARAVEAMKGCTGNDAALAQLILRSPGLLSQLENFRLPTSANACDPAVGSALRRWFIATRFEAYCRSDLCGNDVQKQELRDLVRCFQGVAKTHPAPFMRTDIAEALLDPMRCRVKEDRFHNVESLLRTLMEIGLVHVTGLDEYSAINAWYD